MKIALAMICRGTAEEAEHLATCLKFASPHVDKIFVTLNAPVGEEIHDKCFKVCKKYKAEVSEYVWQDDFAAARNFNFAQVPAEYDYILWLDADDALRNGNVLREIVLRELKDSYAMWYQYDFDENKRPYIVHQKVRVVRNDGTFEWQGRLHEGLVSKRGVSNFLVLGADVLHLSTKQHFEANKERNLRIALKGRDQAPEDPRSYWNSGNALYGNGMYEEALVDFATFLKTTQSDEEKYIACLRVAESLWALNKRYEAVDQLRYAIGLRINYPDAYTKMGMMLVNMKRYQEAIQYLTVALQLPPPEFTIVVFNPREYDYEPIRLLAYAHYELNQVDEALKYFELCRRIFPKDKELEKLTANIRQLSERSQRMKEKAELLAQLSDEDLAKELDNLEPDDRSHPAICHLFNTRFIKKESSGKDLAIFCGFTTHEWNPVSAATKGVGGSEEAVIHLARRWAASGWNVTVFNSCGHKEMKEDGVTYRPWWSWNYRDKQDVTILWRHPAMAEYEINSSKVYVDMHDVLSDGEFTAARLKHIDAVCVKTQAHADCFPSIPGEKLRVIPNGIEPAQFRVSGTVISKEKGLIINTSSADRSLSAFLDIFEQVKQRVPEARAEWAYGWEIFDIAHGSNKKMMEWKDAMCARMRELGVTERGRLNTSEVAELYERGHVFLYPTGFYEIFCISAVKAQLAGAYPVCTDFAALKEVIMWGDAIPSGITAENWQKPYQSDFAIADKAVCGQLVDKVVAALGRTPSECPVRAEIIAKYDWDRVAKVWENIFLS